VEVQEAKLWIDYHTGNDSAREQLLERYLPLAKRLASVVYALRPVRGVEFGDYQQLAYVGLLEAMRRYRPDAGAQFPTFATYRIKGAILNGIPKMTERGEYVSYLRRSQKDRVESLLEQNGAVAPGLGPMLDLVVGIALTYQLDELAEQGEGEAITDVEPYVSRSYDELQGCLREVLAQLSERDRQVVYYHYFHQMSFEDIADVLGLTKGRISQLHKRALAEIREGLRKRRLTELY